MSWCRRWFGFCTVVGAALLAAGCAQDSAVLPQSRDTPLFLNVPDLDAHSHTARSQQPEPPPPSATGVQQASAGVPGGVLDSIDTRFSVHVRAWVNNKALFDDEVRNRLPREELMNAYRLPPEQRDAAMQKILQQTLDNLIDQELLQQDALRKLEKNPKYLEKIKAEAVHEADKQVNALIRANKLPSLEAFKLGLLARGTTLESLRRQFERDFISSEYLKILIFPKLHKIGHEEIREYYDQHLNEFQTVDRVKWQDIFIKVGEKHPTMNDAKQFAQQLVEYWQRGADINKLMEFDDGMGRYQKGMGVGEIKGDIRPVELAPYLFAMKDGEIGPLVELPTGIHVFRLLTREVAGVMPFNEKAQQMISNKLKGEMFERERLRLVRDLREKGNVEVDRTTGK
jgi:hypothetical protein